MARPFKPRPYDPDREDTRSDAQRAATDRNFMIFKLRGLWSQAGMLMEPTRTAVRALIDVDLRERGALPQAEHEREERRKRDARRAKLAAQPDDEFDDIPF
nr:hypothetical protein [Sphingomonas sp. Y57]